MPQSARHEWATPAFVVGYEWANRSLPILVDEGFGGVDAGVPGPVGFDV